MAGLDLAQLGLDGLRELVGTVPGRRAVRQFAQRQHQFLRPATGHALAAECAEMAAIHDDIQAMPMGYNTLVGYLGTVLSGTEAAGDAGLALPTEAAHPCFDEATSHLDVPANSGSTLHSLALRITRILSPIGPRPRSVDLVKRRTKTKVTQTWTRSRYGPANNLHPKSNEVQ